MSYYLHHIFYYILYKKYRILVSNTWIFREIEYPDILNRTIFESLNGKFYVSKYKGLNYITIYTSPLMSDDSCIKFKINDGINGHVSAFFMENHKDKLIKSELAYNRDKKLKELGI